MKITEDRDWCGVHIRCATDDEYNLIREGLYALLERKVEAFKVLADTHNFTEHDFGIPKIQKLIAECERFDEEVPG